MIDIPVLETPRLILRGHRLEDFDSVAALWADPHITRFLGPPSTTEESWARMMRYVGHWAVMGYGFWAFIEKASGRFIGEGGIADFKRDIVWPDAVAGGEDGREVGWSLAAEFHGKGLATEAITAATAWGERRFPQRRLICIINPVNTPSVAVAGRCGFAEIGSTPYKDKEVRVFAR
jgi:RimJ/RimL family protein N-acetyltransferase